MVGRKIQNITIDGGKQGNYGEILRYSQFAIQGKNSHKSEIPLSTKFKAARNRLLSFLMSQILNF